MAKHDREFFESFKCQCGDCGTELHVRRDVCERNRDTITLEIVDRHATGVRKMWANIELGTAELYRLIQTLGKQQNEIHTLVEARLPQAKGG